MLTLSGAVDFEGRSYSAGDHQVAREGAGLKPAPASELRAAPRELRLRLLEVINSDRRAAGAGPVQYSDVLAKAADAHCREMLAGDYASHWDRNGWKPYMRYSAAGIRDSTSENVHAMWTTHFREDKLWDYLLEGHRGFMAEQPPNDGHRRSVLEPRHTHVGVGVAYNGSGLRMVVVFSGRYAQLDPLPLRAKLKDRLTVRGRLLRPSDRLLGISVFYEPLPKPMSRAELAVTFSYGLPSDERMERPRLGPGRRYMDGTRGSVSIAGRQYEAPLSLWKGKPGVYTVAVWVKPGKEDAFIGAAASIIVEDEKAGSLLKDGS
ncbi:MAG: CAP domain-containing protein [Candidatus Acidiferrales bacterium]